MSVNRKLYFKNKIKASYPMQVEQLYILDGDITINEALSLLLKMMNTLIMHQIGTAIVRRLFGILSAVKLRTVESAFQF